MKAVNGLGLWMAVSISLADCGA